MNPTHANRGTMPKHDGAIMVQWSINRKWAGPYQPSAWRQMDWRLGRSNDILAYRFDEESQDNGGSVMGRAA